VPYERGTVGPRTAVAEAHRAGDTCSGRRRGMSTAPCGGVRRPACRQRGRRRDRLAPGW